MTQDPQLLKRLRDVGTALQKAMSERDTLAAERHEPIAIVGIGCRLPGGADGPRAFWELLDNGRDAVVPLDARWEAVGARPGDDVPRWAGLLDGSIDGFDAGFFGISAREARSLDPQHRLLLEVAWEAFEDAGAPRDRQRVGVFVGACSADYGHGVARQLDKDAYSTTGTMLSVAAGRVAYTFGFGGPCLTIDTACSSSLVAIHLACRSLRSRESELAIAGGVNMLLSPETMAGLARLQALSPDGRCRTFDAAANGFVRGEGCGLVVLKRLSMAERDGDRIWAVIRGSAVNQDGRSTGLTAPNVLAQEALLRDALRDARVDGSAIGFIETHGTGTSLGDPIEIEALRSVVGAPRANGSRCLLGAVKTNVGHLEGGAGVVGVIKAVLALHHERIPRNLNFRTLNPRIRLDGSALAIASTPIPWPRGDAPRLAGVSSFGISGTNAHVVVEEAPVAAAARRVEGSHLVVVSAKTAAAVVAQCHRLSSVGAAIEDVAYTLAVERTSLERRIAIVASTTDELRSALSAVTEHDVRALRRDKVAFVFSGQGSQTPGMGRDLHARWPVFRDAFDRAMTLFAAELREVMWGGDGRLDRTGYTQPALFAFEYALAALWRSWGVEPAIVAGHSIGEIVAACVAGVFSLDDAAALVAARARSMEALPGAGAMASVAADEPAVAEAIVGTCVEIAAVNAADQVVIAGADHAVARVLEQFAARGIRTRSLQVSHAFHSAQMDGMLSAFGDAAARLVYRAPSLPIVSNLTGALAGAEIASAAYWVDHVRRTVRFFDGVRALAAAGATSFVEIGPRPVLTAAISSTVPEAIVIGARQPLAGLGEYWANGGVVAWQGVFPDGGSRIELPGYAWQRERHWIDVTTPVRTMGEPTGHPLLGVRVAAAGRCAVYETSLGIASQPWLGDHRVGNRVIVPGAAIAELLRAASTLALDRAIELRSLVLQAPIVIDDGARRVQVAVSDDNEVALYSQPVAAGATDAWTTHATASIADGTHGDRVDLAAIRARCPEAVGEVYERFASVGLIYGEQFRGIARLWRGEREAIAELVRRDADGHGVAPSVVDAAMQAVIGVRARDELAMPFELDAFSVGLPGVEVAWAHVRARSDDSSDIILIAADGRQVAAIRGLRLRRVEAARDAFYRIDWQAAALPTAAAGADRVVVGEASPWTDELCRALHCERTSEVASTTAREIICAWQRSGDESVIDGARRIATEALAVIHALGRRGTPTALRWVTREQDIAAATIWGLGRTAMIEHPELDLRLIEVDDVDAVVRELGSSDDENQIAWRDGQRHVARLVRASRDDATIRELSSGTVIVTGGLGGLGIHVARWLADRGVAHIVLTGRRGLATPGAPEIVAELSNRARVTVAAIDMADRDAVAAMIESIPGDVPLVGVIHAAGVVDDAMLADQDAARFARVLAPKLDAAWHLHELTAERALDFFVLFSSASGLLGAAGQGNYAAANAALDALAAHRRSLGLVATSLAWGPWADAGMATRMTDAQQARLARQGLLAWSPTDGIAQLAAAIDRPDAALGVLRLDLGALVRAFGDHVPPLWRGLVQRAPVVTSEPRVDDVRTIVAGEVARVLSFRGEVPARQPFSELGLDSLMAVELRNGLARRIGKSLPATIAFDHPTIDALADHLAQLFAPTSEPTTPVRVEPASDERIAIIGMGCRYPGGIVDGASYWKVLSEGIDAVTEMPARWDTDALYDPDPDAAGKMTTRSGGFVADIDQFDAGFFGISPREAATMDPQQRLLLETSWEALEHAGVVPERIAGSDTGVFVGLMYQEYASLAGPTLDALDGYVTTGSAGSVASGRLSYVLGLKGPSLTVDTACSSSLVTMHLACQALRRGECSLALAGGVALMLTPSVFVEFSRLRGLAADGRCKSFGANADGVGWAEGCGMLVLKRLRDAERDGDRILAVVRGTAVNQDGRSNGLTAPNGPSQQAVIERALADAGLAAADIDYVECHGTGTRLGDPIEVQALGAAMGVRETPVVIGSVKSNLGHTQAAAGAAGIMKVILALEHEEIPRSLHADEPSPHVPWTELPVAVATHPRAWPRADRPRIAGVSSFGISGTNAHVIVEEPPRVAETSTANRDAQLIVISGKTEAALRAQCARLDTTHELGDLAYSMATRRTAFEHRIAIVARTPDELRGALDKATANTVTTHGKIAFVFSGQGSQMAGMGRDLYARWPVFRDAFERAMSRFEPALRDVMWNGDARLDRTGYTQPALFAFEYAVAALWRSWGVEPAIVAGHSIGEIVAACIADVLSVDDAATLVAARARLMEVLPGAGAMASIAATEQTVAATIAGTTVEIAAVNAPEQIVIAGPVDAVAEARDRFAARGIRTKALVVSHAFHSAQMDGMLSAFGEVAARLTYRAPSLPIISNLSGALAGTEIATPRYWVEHVRRAVRFADGVRALAAAGTTTYIEIGPRPVLVGAIASIVPDAITIGTQDPLQGLGDHWANGGEVSWTGVFPDGGARIELPTYAWQHQRHWIDARTSATTLATALERLAADSTLSAAARAALPELMAALAVQSTIASRGFAEARSNADRLRSTIASPGFAGARSNADALRSTIDPWFHELAWRPRVDPDVSPVGRWIIVGESPHRDVLASALGGTAVIADDVAAVRDAIAPRRLARGTSPISTVHASVSSPSDGVIYVGGDPATALAIVQLVAESGSTRIWLATSGAVSTQPTDPVREPGQALVWGLGRAAALEHPHAWGGLVDLPASLDAEQARRAIAWITAGGEDQVALRGRGAFVARIAPASIPSARGFRTDTAIVTGGLGGLGLHVARWLVDHGTRRLLLVGRRGLATPGATAAVADLEGRGAIVHVATADAADRVAMTAAVRALPSPITAVFHVAGLADTTPVDELSPAHLDRVVAAKRDGTAILDELTRATHLDATHLDAFVCFSSIAGVWGAGRQAAYSASNAFLDAWASAARVRGIPALAIAWGPWDGDGLATDDARAYLAKRGLRALAPARAVQALDRALASDRAHVVIADVDWPTFRAGFEAWGPRSLLAEVAAPVATTDAVAPTMATVVAALRPAARIAHIEDWVAGECAAVLGHADAGELSRNRGFFDLGMDSLMAVKLAGRLRAGLGIKLSPTVIFEQPNIAALAAKLLGELALPEEAPTAVAPTAELFQGSDEDALRLISDIYEKVT